MKRNFVVSCLLLAVILVPVAGSAQPAPEQQPSEEITVFAPYLVQKREIKSDIRTPVLYVSIRHQVSYADLDLTQVADAAEFQSRIHGAADMVCRQFDVLYPPRTFVPLSNVKDCVKTANDQAMMVARDIILFWRQVPR